MAGKSDGFCGHPENAEALRKVLNKSAEIGLVIEGQQTANIPFIAIDKQAQVAALRQRLGDIACGAAMAASDDRAELHGIQSAIIALFDVPNSLPATSDLDSLAAWLWEMGVRA